MREQSGKGPSAPQFWRKKYLIYPQFQLKIIGVQAGLLAGTLFFVGFESFLAFEHLKELGQRVNLPETHPYYKFIALQSQNMVSHLLVAGLLAFALSAVVGLFLSHRLAGPIVRLGKYFRAIEEKGEVDSELHFRKGDYFYEIPSHVNGAFEKIGALKRRAVKKSA